MVPTYPTGPPKRTHSRGAVIQAYADTDALERDCHPPKGCGVKAGDFCVFPDGSQRHIPCISRAVGSSSTPTEQEKP